MIIAISNKHQHMLFGVYLITW